MAKSRTSLLGKLKGLFTGKKSVDISSLDDLEEMLITSDVGARVADSLVTCVRERASGDREISESELKELLKEGIRKELIALPDEHRLYHPVGSPLVILVVGVNGVGKTTTVAKLATRYKDQGKKVIAIAADTFRAAAVQQLNEWGNRSGFTVFSGAENAKPAAVVFDGMVAAKEQGADVVLIDTAGRLHTKSNLMQELEGVRNSIRRHVPDAPHETILVVDGISGQNALSQAREFNASTPLTGLVVTKLDGTPKGGIIVAISQELKIPVFYVGVGEKAKDLIQFSVEEFVAGLLCEDGEAGAQSLSRPSMSGGQEAANPM
jgi:fused signal recognition particle receptor